MLSIETRKYKLISQIKTLDNEKIIEDLEYYIQKIKFQFDSPGLIKPIKEKQVLEDIISEQNYKGVDRRYMDIIISEMDITEPLKDLIEMA